MRINTAAKAGPRGLKRTLVFAGIAAVCLSLGACGSPSHRTGTKSTTHGTSASGAPLGTTASPASGSKTSAAAGGASSLPVCQTSQLKIAIGSTGAVGGTSGGDLVFTNTASSACKLEGWPQLVGITDAGTSQAAVQVHSTQFGPFNGGNVSAIRIDAGGTAGVAFIVGTNTCTDTYRTLQVTPPGNTQSVEVSAWLPKIQTYLPACAPINVSPLVLASQLPNPAPVP